MHERVCCNESAGLIANEASAVAAQIHPRLNSRHKDPAAVANFNAAILQANRQPLVDVMQAADLSSGSASLGTGQGDTDP